MGGKNDGFIIEISGDIIFVWFMSHIYFVNVIVHFVSELAIVAICLKVLCVKSQHNNYYIL